MPFSGVIERFDRKRISGWAHHDETAGVSALGFQLVFRNRAPIVARTATREAGTGYIFDLPAEIQALSWADFVNAFDAVLAIAETPNGTERWRVPMFKSVLLSSDLMERPAAAATVAASAPAQPGLAMSVGATTGGAAPAGANRTTLAVSRPKDYAIDPVPQGRIAAFTIAYNEAVIVPIWARYYADIVGAENLYILDQGSTCDYTTMVPKGVTVIRLPRDAFDNWLIARTVATFQRFLLESYDSVLYTDSDEFLCVDPAVAAGRDLRQFLLEVPEPIGITTGFNLWHDLDNEPAYDPEKPVLTQRRLLQRETSMDKPLIARVPVSWVPGFHSATEGGTPVAGLYMLHLRMFDLDHALTKGGHYRTSKWNPYDVTHRLASYQRMGEAEIVKWFREMNQSFSRTEMSVFDPEAKRTVIADWMRAAVAV